MIDEPELNIHPENQRHIARLLARLVNAGLRIVISTHSDYIVREFNSLLMLGQDTGELKLIRDQRDWLIPANPNVRVRSPHRHSMGFSLDVPESQQKPPAFFSGQPPRYLAKICDALIAVAYRNKLYLFAIEAKSRNTDDNRRQLANGRHFWCRLIALCKEHDEPVF